MLCIPDSEYYDLFSESERNEFLFRLFKHIVIGGELVQPNDDLETYTNFVRNLYKDLISVQKMQDPGGLGVISLVYEVKALVSRPISDKVNPAIRATTKLSTQLPRNT